jgi:hypothetical protein
MPASCERRGPTQGKASRLERGIEEEEEEVTE